MYAVGRAPSVMTGMISSTWKGLNGEGIPPVGK